MEKRIIAHLDMDAFFASLEERFNPQFKGLPIAVGADPKDGRGRGVVSTANYKAREYGIHSALPISIAWRLSEEAKKQGKPGVAFVQPDFSIYEKSSQNVFEIIKKHAKVVEQGSIDEFYFDLTFAKNFKKAEDICKKIKEEIKKKEKVTCSIGFSVNKLISKIAAPIKKPDGLFMVLPKEVEDFLNPLPIRKIPGVGPKTEEVLNKEGVKIVKDIKRFSESQLIEMFGKWGSDLYQKARGIDESPIVEEREVKSIGEQTTFEEDTNNPVFIGEQLGKLQKDVFRRFKESGFEYFKTITIVIRFSDFQTQTSAKSFKEKLSLKDEGLVKLEVLKLLLPYFDKRKNPKSQFIRLIGFRLDNLSH